MLWLYLCGIILDEYVFGYDIFIIDNIEVSEGYGGIPHIAEPISASGE